MWGFLPTVSLLIGVILANCEITDVTEVETDAIDRNGLSDSNTWQEKVAMGEIEERIDPNHETDATDTRNEYLGHPEDRRIESDSRGLSNGRDNVDTWLDLAKSKELRNLPSSQRRRKKKKKTTPWIYQWGNKRTESAEKDARMFRVPFNSWGGKRGSTFSALQENMYDRYGRDLSADGNVKKKAEDIERVIGKVRFNSWGGKRSEQPRYLTSLKERVYTPVLRVYKVYGSTKGKNNGKNGEKENNFLYRIQSSQDDSTSSDIDGRLILEKRTKYHEKCKKDVFDPWGGKRSYKPNSIPVDKTVAYLACTEKGKPFLCYPIEELK